MIWHVNADDFYDYLRKAGFRPVAQTSTQILYQHEDGRSFFVRRSTSLTKQEVDIISDANGLTPPPMEEFFGL